MCLEHQPRWSPNAPSNSADATSTVGFGQAIANSNGFVGPTDPTNPLTAIHRGLFGQSVFVSTSGVH
jgi:hypothetical protein